MQKSWQISVGVSYINIYAKGSNVVLENSNAGLNSAEPQRLELLVPAFSSSFTFKDEKTQLFFNLGGQSSYSEQDGVGVRRQLDNGTLLSVSLNQQTKDDFVFIDPFENNRLRQATNQTSEIIKLELESLFGTQYSMNYSFKESTIINDLSGTNHLPILSPAQLQSLQRSNQKHQFELFYFYPKSNQLIFLPSFNISKVIAEGRSQSYTEYGLSTTAIYFYNDFQFYLDLAISKNSFESSNPIFNQFSDGKVQSIAMGFEYANPFNIQSVLSLNFIHAKTDTNIHFYDNSLNFFSIGIQFSL